LHWLNLIILFRPTTQRSKFPQVHSACASTPYISQFYGNPDPQSLRFYVPFIRTLLPASTEKDSRQYVRSTVREDGDEAVAEFAEQFPRERVLKYLPIGNYKW
jgi:alkaline phosphatase D